MNILYFDFHNLLAILLIRDIYIILEDQIIFNKTTHDQRRTWKGLIYIKI